MPILKESPDELSNRLLDMPKRETKRSLPLVLRSLSHRELDRTAAEQVKRELHKKEEQRRKASEKRKRDETKKGKK